MTEQSTAPQSVTQEMIDLVIARLQTIPSGVSISVGDKGTFSVEDLIESVKKGNEIGNMIVGIQLDYLKSLKDLATDGAISTNN